MQNLVKVVDLKHFCHSKNLSDEPSFQFRANRKTNLVMANCQVEELVKVSFAKSEETAINLSAELMLEHLKTKYPTGKNPGTNNLSGQSQPSSSNDQEIILKYKEFHAKSALKSKSADGFEVSLENLHLSGELDPFFTDNQKMQQLKTISVQILTTLADPFALIKEILDVKKVEYKWFLMPTHDNTCCVVLNIFSGPMWTMMGEGKTLEEAKLDASREMLMFFKNMLSS